MIIPFIIATFIGSMFAGFFRSRNLLRKNDISITNVHRHLSELFFLVPLAIFGIIAMIVIRSHYQLLWYLPVWLDLVSMHLIWLMSGCVFAYVFTIGLTICFRTKHPERYKLVIATVLLGIIIGGMQIYWNLPIYEKLAETTTTDGFVMQTSSSSCATASAANVMIYFGKAVTEKEMAKLTGTTILGTSPGQIVYALKTAGIAAEKKSLDANQLSSLSQPAILFIDYPGLGPDSHAVAFLPTKTQKIRIIDPLSGGYEFDVNRFPWKWRGHLLECRLKEQEH